MNKRDSGEYSISKTKKGKFVVWILRNIHNGVYCEYCYESLIPRFNPFLGTTRTLPLPCPYSDPCHAA